MNTKEILQGIKNWTAGKLDTKVDKVTGKGLSTNDYTTDEKNKLSGIETGAQKHIAPTASEVKTALGTGSGTTKYLREDGTWQTPEGGSDTDVAYDTTNKKITKTIDGTTSDVVTSEKVVEDGGGMNLVEGYYYNKKFYKEAAHTTEITGADGRIYIDKDTNREFRWDGTKYQLLKSEVDGSFVNEGTFAYRPTAGALDVESGAVGEGGAQIECVKGNTIAWNQLVGSGSAEVTPVSGRKIFISSGGEEKIVTADGNPIPVKLGTDKMVDLSMVYGEGNEPSSASQFINDYYNWFGSNKFTNSLPYDAEIEYIETTGTQYIDTGITVDHNFGITLDAQLMVYGQRSYLQGAYRQSQMCFDIGYARNSSNPASHGFIVRAGTTSNTKQIFADTTKRHVFGWKASGIFFVDNTEESVTFDASAFDGIQRNFLLSTTTGSDAFAQRIYACRIYSGTTIVRDLIPVRIGTVGYLYDKISGELLGNAGTGSFVLGGDTCGILDEPYDEGSLRSVEMTGIKTVGFNQYNQATGKANVVAGEEYQITGTYTSISENGATITPDADGKFTPTTNEVTVVGGGNDTCIHLVHSGDRNGDYEPYWEHTASLPVTSLKGKLNGEGSSVVIFPDGMKKAGTVYDEIVKRGNQTVAIKRIGQVDLGTLEWSYFSSYQVMMSQLQQPTTTKATISNLLISSRYNIGIPADSTCWSDYANNSVFRGKNSKSLLVKDTSYTDAATFQAAMDGVMLYYELATPQEYIIDDIDFPTEYPVDDYGTEEILANSAKSLAPTLDIRYGLNATDTLRNLPSKYVSAVEEQNFTEAQKERARVNIGAACEDVNIAINALTRHTRLTDFDLSVLKQAVADGNLEKYGLKVGDQKTINGHTYVIADLNPMKGTSTPYRLTTNHVGLIVIPHTTQAWNASGNTAQGADDRGAGYLNCDLHYYLKNTLLPLVETDLGAANLLGHSKLLSNAVTDGKASNWTWEADCKICALSEVQVYGSVVWGASGYDTGEACRQLAVFQKYSHTEIFGGEYPWLRDVVSASSAALAYDRGAAYHAPASLARFVAALILFN